MVSIVKRVIKYIYWKLPLSNYKKRRFLDLLRSGGVKKFFFKEVINDDVYHDYVNEILRTPRNLDNYSPLVAKQKIESRDYLQKSPKLVAYYLTQFHPTPENDEWWGKGVTEWNNVFRGVPQFVGHYQPRIPGELGAYDLRLKENIERQVELAKIGGLYGFAFYYYWFNGTTLLRKPLDIFLENSDIDFPFMLCWANESWTKRFDGSSQDELMSFSQKNEDNFNFIKDSIRYITDGRYIRHDGKPVIQIYKPSNFQDIKSLISYWRKTARELGVGELHFMAVLFGDAYSINWKSLGFDSASDFQPGSMRSQSKIKKVNNKIDIVNKDFLGQVYDYGECAAEVVLRNDVYPAVMPSWDNSARRIDSGLIFHNSSPQQYSIWLERSINHTLASDRLDANFIFINAWNEWGEGAYLEPDKKFGYSYLNATRKVMDIYL